MRLAIIALSLFFMLFILGDIVAALTSIDVTLKTIATQTVIK